MRTARDRFPAPLTRLIGREVEVTVIEQLLVATRLLTLTGVGGSGKTRLALQVGMDLRDHFRDGIYFIPLATISDALLVLPTIAQALGLKDAGDGPVIDTLIATLAPLHILLILDNFEQIVLAAPLIAELLARCPTLHVLVTSRAPLHVSGERQYPVLPLTLPNEEQVRDLDGLAEVPAVALFLERARAVLPDFALTNETAPAVAAICSRLDGLPLAIELAAARVKHLTPSTLQARLSRSLTLLTGGMQDVPLRQQTLRATIEWSYDLLTPEERILFAWLAIFAGGGTLQAIEAIGNAGSNLPSILDGISSLVDKSLVERIERSGSDPRFGMLETIREYAAERLTASEEEPEMRYAHGAYYLTLAEDLAAELRPSGHTTLRPMNQLDTIARFEAEHDNFRRALEWALERGEAEIALRLSSALGGFLSLRGYWSEGRRWLEAALDLSGDIAPSIRARALIVAARLAWWQKDTPTALVRARTGLTIMQEADDKAGITDALRILGHITHYQGDTATARSLLEQSLATARDSGDQHLISDALSAVGTIAMTQGDFVIARAHYTESLATRQEVNDKVAIVTVLHNLGTLAYLQGNLAASQEHYERSLATAREIGDEPGSAAALTHLGSLAYAHGEYDSAQVRYEESLAIRSKTGDKIAVATLLRLLGNVARAQGDAAVARARFEESLAISRESRNEQSIAYGLSSLGRLALDEGDNGTARTMCEQALAIARQHGEERCIAVALNNAAHVAKVQDDYTAAVALFQESLVIFRRIGGPLNSIYCLEGIAAVIGRQGQGMHATRLWGAIEALRESIGASRPLGSENRRQEDLAAVRAYVDEAEWAAAWAEGRAMTLERATVMALDASWAGQPTTLLQRSEVATSPTDLPAGLTTREVEVLRLLAAGHTNREIADALSLSEHTIHAHVSHIYTKTASDNRAAVTRFALRHGLV
jgi:predicted ATPase/DNA-binding CsgD family transcriptional regulator/Tfp pilus assembly protein PilF